MLTLPGLRALRKLSTLTRMQLATITGIEDQRLRLLEIRQVEPWFDEALILSRVLCLTGINPLLGSGSLTVIAAAAGPPTAADRIIWKSSARKPLSLACRVAIAFGLHDPVSLSVGLLERQIWEIVSTNERAPVDDARAICPWCQADLFPYESVAGITRPQHLPTCLPDNLWAPHDRDPGGMTLLPQRKASRAVGIPARGLKALRLARQLIQKEVADVLGMHANYYARLERGDVNLVIEHADKLVAYYGVDRAVLYAQAPQS